MPSIGSIVVDTIRGRPMPMGMVLTNQTRTGVDGVALFQEGKRPPVSPVVTTEAIVTSTKDIPTREAEYQALRGTIVSVTDGFGDTTPSVAVLDVKVRAESAKLVDGAVAVGTPDVMLTAEWTLVSTAIP